MHFVQSVKLHLCRWSLKIKCGPWKVLKKWLHCFVWTLPSSKTQEQSVRLGEKAWWKYSSMGGRTPGYWLSPDHSEWSSKCWLLIGHRKCFVLLCQIGEQHLLSSFCEFVHKGYCLTILVWFVNQGCEWKGNFHFPETKELLISQINVSDAISRNISIIFHRENSVSDWSQGVVK